MECWSEKTLICFVMFDDDEVLVSLPPTPDSERARHCDGGWVRQSITEWNQFWSLIPEQLSSLTKNLITGASSIISNCSDCHSDKIYVLSLAPRTLALCRVITPDCKSVRLSPSPPPVNLSASGNAMQVWGFPGPPPPPHLRTASDHLCLHILCAVSRYL